MEDRYKVELVRHFARLNKLDLPDSSADVEELRGNLLEAADRFWTNLPLADQLIIASDALKDGIFTLEDVAALFPSQKLQSVARMLAEFSAEDDRRNILAGLEEPLTEGALKILELLPRENQIGTVSRPSMIANLTHTIAEGSIGAEEIWQALQSLPPKSIREIFATVPSINEQIDAQLHEQMQNDVDELIRLRNEGAPEEQLAGKTQEFLAAFMPEILEFVPAEDRARVVTEMARLPISELEALRNIPKGFRAEWTAALEEAFSLLPSGLADMLGDVPEKDKITIINTLHAAPPSRPKNNSGPKFL